METNSFQHTLQWMQQPILRKVGVRQLGSKTNAHKTFVRRIVARYTLPKWIIISHKD